MRDPSSCRFLAVAKKYPDKQPAEILADLAADTPGEEGKWFAAAKDAKLYDVALDLARRSPCDPRTLVRAARDFAARKPAFAVEAGLLALHWIVEGHGYEITGLRERIGQLVARDAPDGIVRRILSTRLARAQ